MTDQTPDTDELVSAYLDGEATAAEVALVEASPELMQQVVRFRAVAEAVAAPVPTAPVRHRDEAIAAAIAASSTERNVTSLATRRKRSAQTLRLASVAAVVAIFMLAGSLLLLSRSTDSDTADTVAADSSTAAEEPAEESDGGLDATDDAGSVSAAESQAAPEADQEESEPAEEPAEEAATEAAPADETAEADDAADGDAERSFSQNSLDDLRRLRRDIDVQPDVEAVASALLDQIDLPVPPDAADEAGLLLDDIVFECLTAIAEDSGFGEPINFAVTTLAAGTPVLAVVFESTTATFEVVVAESETCAILGVFPE